MIPRLPLDSVATVLSFLDVPEWHVLAHTCTAGRDCIQRVAALLTDEMTTKAARGGGTLDRNLRKTRLHGCLDAYEPLEAAVIAEARATCNKKERLYGRNLAADDPHAPVVVAVASMFFARPVDFAGAQHRVFMLDFPTILSGKGSTLLHAMTLEGVKHFFCASPKVDAGDRPVIAVLKKLWKEAVAFAQAVAAIDGGVDYMRFLSLRRLQARRLHRDPADGVM
eukprot:TRINITY_DN9323_c0_g1_i1.p1 TRINITY_DN9323_c0_g1~~TRINITY_DN9323_c0_g1_i1.p1  ORF type:complete len:224 (+),score=34.77 TRINITY_DN9323_c0_g1_i1:345-1016(+)